MYHAKVNRIVQCLILIALVTVALQPVNVSANYSDGPELPAGCGSITVEAGHKLAFHVYARGAQVYRWNGISWDFVAPVASLFAEEGFHGEVGTHYVGPHWESKSGSKVKAARVQGTGCTPDPNSIPWILLKSTENSGPGIFNNTTYIQRTNTSGGNAPTVPGTTINELKEVPYTAEYYFYRAENPNGN